MQLDFDYFSKVLAGTIRAITDDQLVLRHALELGDIKKLRLPILRSRYNTHLISQIIYIGQSLASCNAQAVGLMEGFEQALKSIDQNDIKVVIARDKPLVDVLADSSILVAILIILFCLIKLENINNKTIHVSLRRRDGYISIKFEGARVTKDLVYEDELVGFINMILRFFGGNIKWGRQSSKRVIFLRLHLSSQMPLRYNG